MKKKLSNHEKINLFFSAFLILAYIVCGYFFSEFAGSLGGDIAKAAVTAAIAVIFGLLVFYATRVGEGKPIKRFSLITLILLDLPALCIILTYIFPQIPLHEQIASAQIVAFMAAASLGYGLPYTFFSGFETAYDDEVQPAKEQETVLEGGVEADLEIVEEQIAEEADEIVVEGTALEEAEEIEQAKEQAEQTEVTEEKTDETEE